MGELSTWTKIKNYIDYVPIRLAYRLVWLSAKLGSPTGKDVYKAMWDANCDLPVLGTNESNS